MSDMAMKYKDWLRGCVYHDGRKGNVYLPCDTVLEIADWIEAHKDAVPVVRCKDCKWYEPPHILHDDGTKTYVDDGSPYVPASVGINVGGKCMNTLREYCLNHDREDPNDYERLVKFRERMDFCSGGERKNDDIR